MTIKNLNNQNNNENTTTKETINMLNIKKLLDEITGTADDYAADFENYDNNDYIDDAISEIADNKIDIYFHDLIEFFRNYSDYVEEALSQFGWDGCGKDIWKAIQMGEMLYYQEEAYEHKKEALEAYALNYYKKETDADEIPEELYDEILDIIKKDPDYFNELTDAIDEYLEAEEDAEE